MKKLLIIGIAITISFSNSFSQNEVKDFEKKYGEIVINRATKEAIETINSIENVSNKRVAISKLATQEDFDVVCSSLSWIRKLEIASRNEFINNINSINKLTSLTELKISSLKSSNDNPLDLNPLKTLVSLKKLDFYATKVKNTDALKVLTNLEDVSFYMSSVSSISFLEGTPKIKKLNLYGFGHTFENYEPIAKLEYLEEINIYMNKQANDENLEPFKSLNSLKKISMSNNKIITTLDFLENCTQMERIDASWCTGIADFSALVNMPKLKILKVSDSKLDNLSFLKDKLNLTTLDVSGTMISDISLLSECVNLEKIDISETSVTDISALNKCVNIEDINVSKTTVSDISPLFDCKRIRYLKISSKVPEHQVEQAKTLYEKIRITVKD
ncbi:MAG: leucine-rich repeat domain-containing protein [Bacteroidota bacterium]